MHPYVIDRIVHERHEELTRLARADRAARAVRMAQASSGGPDGDHRVAGRRLLAALTTPLAAAVGRSRTAAPRRAADLRACLDCPPAS